jgi:hypothetical protein
MRSLIAGLSVNAGLRQQSFTTALLKARSFISPPVKVIENFESRIMAEFD